jgi:ABC-type nickel/cobalt efflux system permease component RcnA
MIDTVVIQPGADTGEPSVAGVSWAAVAAGAIVCCAVTLVVLAFGIGLGLSVVSPWGGSGASATIFKIGTGLYLVVVAMLSSSIGGQAVSLLRVKMRKYPL